MNKDWSGNTKSAFAVIGATGHFDGEREEHDFYATEPKALDYLLEEGGLILNNPVWECACGQGHLSEQLKKYGYDVHSTDLIDRGYPGRQVNFLTCQSHWYGDILTNPPYKYAQEFVEHAMELIDDGHQVIMFLKLTFLEGKNRKEMYKHCPLKTLYVSSSRLRCAKNGVFDKNCLNAIAYGWFVFEKGYKGKPSIEWIN